MTDDPSASLAKNISRMPWEEVYQFCGMSLLVFRPAGTQFGHLNLEVMFASSTARRNGSWLYLVQPLECVNRTCFSLVMPGVKQVRSRRILDWWFNRIADRSLLKNEVAARLEKSNCPQGGEPKAKVRRWLPKWPSDVELLALEFKLRRWRPFSFLRRGNRAPAFELASGPGLSGERYEFVQRELKRLKHQGVTLEKEFVRLCRNTPKAMSSLWWWRVVEWGHRRRVRRAEARQRLLVAGQGDIYFKRRLLAEVVPMHLPTAKTAELDRLALKLGVDPDRPVVTLHVREAGFKKGAEVHDKFLARGAERGTFRDDTVRNNTIENYLPAIELLTGRGFSVVRLGDKSMTPLEIPGLVDVATHPEAVPELDYYFIARSRFLIGCDSGPLIVPWMTGTPLLLLNLTHPMIGWPIGPFDLQTPKYIRDRRTGKYLTLAEACDPAHADHFRVTSLYDYDELTPDDIVRSVEEMLKLVEHSEPPPETDRQRAYRQMYLAKMAAPTLNSYFRKWGPDRGFLGAGRMTEFSLERDAAGSWHPPGWQPEVIVEAS